MAKKKLKFLQHVVYDPNPKFITGEGKKMVGIVMLFLGEIPDAPGHCVVLHGDKVRWMEHTESFRAATEEEF